jgi:hypothetical protein
MQAEGRLSEVFAEVWEEVDLIVRQLPWKV